MSEYAKKKNDELAALCKERGLPHNGKKADLVKRLEEYDAQATTTGDAQPVTNEDEIDWDEEPTSNAPAAERTEPESAATVEGNEQQGTAELETSATTTGIDSTNTEAPTAPSKDFSAGIPEASLDEEIEKRKARARRFGLPEDSEEIKMLIRAKRFGTSEVPGLLNKSLPATSAHERKRGAADASGGVRKKSRGRPGPGKPQERKPQDKPAQAQAKADGAKAKESNGGYPAWMSAADREKADKRKARFASAPGAEA